MEFIKSLGTLALGHRLKKNSDQIFSDISSLFKELDIDFEPRWFPLFTLLSMKGDMTVVQAAQELGVTQPAISQFSRELLRVDLIEIKKDPNDSRKRILALSKSGQNLTQHLKPIRNAIQRSFQDIINEEEIDLIRAIERFESAIERKSLYSRAVENLKNVEETPIKIVSYSSRYKEDFKRLNEEWIDAMFDREDTDRKALGNPEEHFIKKGGKIFFAVTASGEAVGTCALRPGIDGSYELSKMAVTPRMQGHRIGEMLVRRALWQVKMQGKNKCYLMTNSNCSAAIHIYKKLGFREAPEYLARADYNRANVAMEIVV